MLKKVESEDFLTVGFKENECPVKIIIIIRRIIMVGMQMLYSVNTKTREKTLG